MKQKILSTTMDCYGEKIPTAVIQKNGMLYIWEVNCFSSQNYNLGNCRCVNHDAATERPISTAEVIQRFGVRSLDGFEKPGREQLVFDAFGIEVHEMETFLRVSYMLGINPLPALRDKGAAVVFSETAEGIAFPDAEPGIVFIVNSRGEISVREV